MTTPMRGGARIDRAALERIIQRAAELQAGERDIGEGLTEAELLQLGAEVGIPAAHLRQALLEEQTRAVVPRDGGLAHWLAGQRFVGAARTVPHPAAEVERALHTWMVEGELLQVKRRYPDQTAWETQHGTMATIKRSLRTGGRKYTLAKAHEVTGRVTAVDAGRAHVRLIADLSKGRSERLVAATSVSALGGGATAVGIILGVALPISIAVGVLGLAVGTAIARTRGGEIEEAEVALEQVLDRLEHGDVDPRRAIPGPRESAFARIADEIRKSFGA